jgi:hypothetical protein
MANMIRNIRQTAQEREIVKTAPDIVVYLDGLPYLLNPYLQSQNGQDYTLVNFNDYVQNFSATYDVDNLKPSCSVVLSVPNYAKYLFQAPGGNNLIETMMELQVFAKNYFPAADGNTVYTRVFKGVVSHLVHTDTGKSVEITIQGQGVLRFFELMQIELNPALLTNADRSAQVLKNNQANLNPYQQLADTFLRGISFEGFQLNSILQQRVQGSDEQQAVEAGYVSKWKTILLGIRKDVHIFGYTFGSVLPMDIDSISTPNSKKGKVGPEYFQISDDTVGKLLESDPAHDLYVNILKGYLPDFQIGTIQLLNGNITSRLERIRQIILAIGMEGFQDINGEIVVKPPLYNLDCTDTTPIPVTQSSPNAPKQTSTNQRFTQNNNPFIVHLAEIISESETEDEQGIRATRVTIQPDWSKTFHLGDGTSSLREAVWHIDIPKLAKFGLREEPARTLPWLVSGDKFAAYTYAVSELNRANRGFRTYQITIPLRPELHLGFPMYFPHRDMYGYIRSVSIAYQQGGEASTSILLDTLRKRPMFPSTHVLNNTTDQTSGQPQEVTIYTTQPNLVMKWTTPQQKTVGTTGPSLPGVATGPNLPSVPVGSTNSTKQGTAGTGDVASDDPAVNLVNNPATLQQLPTQPVYPEQIQIMHYRREQLGTSWGTKADTTSKSFRVQNDKDSDINPGQPFFSRERWITPRTALDSKGNPLPPTKDPVTGQMVQQTTSGIDSNYFQRILWEQPYTDEKGYEVITPFPWGRWKTLTEAYYETRLGNLVEYVNPQDLQVLTGINTFLFTGEGTPQTSLEPGSALQNALSTLQSQVENSDSFELASATANAPGTENQILSLDQPENLPTSDVALTNQIEDELQQKVDLFLSGTPSPTPATQSELDIALDPNIRAIGVTPAVKQP